MFYSPISPLNRSTQADWIKVSTGRREQMKTRCRKPLWFHCSFRNCSNSTTALILLAFLPSCCKLIWQGRPPITSAFYGNSWSIARKRISSGTNLVLYNSINSYLVILQSPNKSSQYKPKHINPKNSKIYGPESWLKKIEINCFPFWPTYPLNMQSFSRHALKAIAKATPARSYSILSSSAVKAAVAPRTASLVVSFF